MLRLCDICHMGCMAEHIIDDMDKKRAICIYCFAKERPEQIKNMPEEYQKLIKENPDG